MSVSTLDLFRDQPAPGPFSRRGAVPTSRDAAAAIAHDVGEMQWRVLLLFNAADLTADEAANALSEHFMRVRPRVAELHKAGLLEPTGEKRPSSLRNPQAVMRLTRRGERALEVA